MKPRDVDVLLVAPAMADEVVGGIQTTLRIAWGALEESSLESHLFRFEGKGSAGSGGHPSDRVAVSRTKTGAALRALRTRLQPRILLVGHLGLLKLLPLLKGPHTKVVLWLYGIEAWVPPSPLTKRLLKQVDHFMTISDHTWERFVITNPWHAGSAHTTVHLGWGSPLERDPRTPDPVPYSVIISRLLKDEDYKGHRELITAWPLILGSIPTARLHVIGTGDLLPELHALAQDLGVGSNIRFEGFLDDHHKERLIEGSRCLAMPSKREGFGLVYVEAMRLGRPCIVSDVDAGKEVAGEAGLAVRPDDHEAIARALVLMFSGEKDWKYRSQVALTRYASHFTEQHFRDRFLAAVASWF